MIEIKNFVEISKYAGERFDLVQASGGNSSVKITDTKMLIKASGFLLSDVNENKGYSKVDFCRVAKILKDKSITDEIDKTKREVLVKKLIEDATLDKNNRPSIETLLHSSLYKYTLHTHPVVVNMVVIQKEWREMLTSIFKDEEIALVPYKTPGIDLALELVRVISTLKKTPKIIFLQNHGLIITSNNIEDIKKITELVLEKIEKFLKIDMHRYKMTNKISNMIDNIEKNSNIVCLSEDRYLNEQLSKNIDLFFLKPFCPDSLVFCGISAVKIKDFLDVTAIHNYRERYFELPKVVIFEENLFLVALNVKKAKEVEEVLKFHIMVLEQSKETNNNFLDSKEISYLSSWEAEKFRKKI